MSKNELFYIQSRGYCGNALFWWGKQNSGYTTDIRKAGKYTREQAKSICERPGNHAYACDYIDNLLESQKLVIDSQYVDSSKRAKFNQ